MRKLLILSAFTCILSSCSVDSTPSMYWVYTVRYNQQTNQYGGSHWSAHNVSMLEVIDKPYKWIKCYVDDHRDREDWPSRSMVQSYDKDTNDVQVNWIEDHTWLKNPKQNPYGLRALECSNLP